MSYGRSKEVGRFGEQCLKCILEKAGAKVLENPARSKKGLIGWDLAVELGEKKFTVEVKFDQMEAATGNVAVEYFNTKQARPSGILATKSDLWAFVLRKPTTVWACNTKALRDWFQTKPFYREVACGGDDNAAIRLYRRAELFSSLPFERLDDKEPALLGYLLLKMLGGPANPSQKALAG